MKSKRVLAVFAALLFATFTFAQSFPQQAVASVPGDLSKVSAAQAPAPEKPDEEAIERARLHKLPPTQLQATNTPMRSLVRWLAEQAQMSYISIPQGEVGDTPISFNAYKNPFEMLETLSQNYSLGMTYSNGMWHFYGQNIHELIARTYQLKYNTTEEFDSGNNTSGSGSGSNFSNSGSNSGSLANNTSGFSGSNGSSNGSSTTTSGFGSGGSSVKLRSDQAKRLVTAIDKFLDTGSTGAYATFLRDGSVGDFFPVPSPDLASAAPAAAAAGIKKGNVTFNSDNNQLYVLATRQQHEYIEGLLESFDRPQRLISIETKFTETSRDVSRNLGINWAGATGAAGVSLSGLTTNVDLNHIAATKLPSQAILSASDFALTASAIANDSTSTDVQYPRVVTVNNRQVSLRSVVERPVLNSTTSTTGSGLTGAQTIQSVSNIEIGTVVDILPKIMDDASGTGDNVLLNIVVSVSNITGSVVIQGNTYPITSNRLFTYQVIVKSGHTLAVGGLEETYDTTAASKIPGLGDIPFFGLAFKSTNPTRSARSLLMFVTPTILNGYAGGVPDRPIAVTPLVGAQGRPQFTGSERETVEDVRRSLGSFRQEIASLHQLAREARATKKDVTEAELLRNELDLMDLKLREELQSKKHIPDAPVLASTIGDYRRELTVVRKELSSAMGLPWN